MPEKVIGVGVDMTICIYLAICLFQQHNYGGNKEDRLNWKETGAGKQSYCLITTASATIRE